MRSSVLPDQAEGMGSGAANDRRRSRVRGSEHREPGPQFVGPPPALLPVLAVFDLLAPGNGALAPLLGLGAEPLHLGAVAGPYRLQGILSRGEQLGGQQGGRRPRAVEARGHRSPQLASLDESPVVRQQPGALDAAPRRLGQLGGELDGHARRHEPVAELGGGHRVEFDTHTTTGHGGHLRRHGVGEQDEDRLAGRLFERLQQDGGGQPGEVDVRHHDHLPMAFERAPLGKPHHAPGIVHGHERARPFDLHQIGMYPGQGSATYLAHAAPSLRAQERGGEAAYQRTLTQPRLPHEQIGVHWPPGRGAQLGDGIGLAHDVSEQPDGSGCRGVR